MVSSNIWGPVIWTFLHTMIEKLKNDKHAKELFDMICLIITHLPCPSCSAHAKLYLNRNSKKTSCLTTKQQVKDFLFTFHNNVNLRVNKKQLIYEDFKDFYKTHKLNLTFNHFRNVYNTRGNMVLIVESFQRNIALKKISHWFITNRSYFN